ncbi:MAG: PAS domain S-box protein [Thermodesulfovibrionales bacterium]
MDKRDKGSELLRKSEGEGNADAHPKRMKAVRTGGGTHKNSQQTFEALVSCSPLAIIAVDPAGNVTIWNPAAERIFGWRAEEVLGGLNPIVSPERQEEFHSLLKSILEGTACSDVETTRRRKDGSDLDVRISASPVFHAKGGISGVMAVINDITEQKRAEQKLRESEKKFRALFESSHDVIVFLDRAGNIININPRAETLTGYAKSELCKMNVFDDLIIAEDHPIIRQVIKDAFEGRTRTYEERWKTRGGEIIWFEGLTLPRRSPQGEVLSTFCTLRDITDRKLAEEKLRQSERDLAEAQRVAGLGNWILDIVTNTVRWSEELYHIFEVEKTEFDGTYESFMSRVHPDDKPLVLEINKRARESGEPFEVEYRTVTRAGRLKHIREIGYAMKDAEGRVVGLFGTAQDITWSKRMEVALKQSEEVLRGVIDNLAIGVSLISPEMEILMLNKQMLQWFPGIDVSKKPICYSAFNVPPGEEICSYCPTCKTLMDGDVHESITESPAGNEIRNYRILSSPIRDKDGKITAAIEMVEDITERKRTEEALRASERQYRQLVDNALVGVYKTTLEGKFLYVNDAMARIFECENADEMLLLPVGIRYKKPEDREAFLNILKDRGKVPYYEIEVPTKTGKLKTIVISAVLDDGFIAGMVTDITERKKAEDALQKIEKRYKDLFGATLDGIYQIDADGVFILINSAGAKMLGYESPDEIIGKKGLEYWRDPRDRDAFRAELNIKKSVSGYHMRLKKKNGEPIELETSSAIKEDEEGAFLGMEGILRDVTERKKLEAQLRHAQKMEAVGTLAGGIAHDFNNILNVIIGYGSMVLDRLEDDSISKDQMNEVIAAAERAANLTKRLLTFSRKQITEVKPIDVNGTVTGIHKMLVRIIGEDIDFNFDLADKRLVVMADAGQIEQVLMNLATNARDAMPNGGRLTIGTGLEEIDYEYIALNGYGRPGMYALITVSDTGHGMDAETQKKIFEPFFTTKGLGEGTGLGLAISYGIIKQHNGYIKVYSEPGQGTVFKIYLPLIEESASLERETEAPDAIKGGNETVLVAEDDASLRDLSRIVLESFGYSVITAEDGEDAIAKFMENRERIHLVMLDMIMPKKNGKEVSEVLRKASPGIKILFLSGYTMDIIKSKELMESGVDLIHKPIRPQDLLRKVREVLDK